MGTTDQVLTSKARAPLCLMVLAPKYQAKVQLSLTQLTAKYLARMQNFLKERACRAMAPRSLMILIAIRQVRGRSLINPGRSSLTRELLRKILPFQAMVFSPQFSGQGSFSQQLRTDSNQGSFSHTSGNQLSGQGAFSQQSRTDFNQGSLSHTSGTQLSGQGLGFSHGTRTQGTGQDFGFSHQQSTNLQAGLTDSFSHSANTEVSSSSWGTPSNNWGMFD